MADGPGSGYTQKSFSLPVEQVRWLRQLRKEAFAEDVELHEVVVVREAIDRLMHAGNWKALRGRLIDRLSTEPKRGRRI